MLSELLPALQDLLWGIGLISAVIILLWLLPKSYSLKLGERPLLLIALFIAIIIALLNIFS
ncbi:hypothetical protein N8502_01115 [Gammaproteobacteria bacterium]|nr:hypothetical protein [Gammaproteobacteria bacterium]MDC1525156.1 hypothetical protein [Gammaproteobacteria bacterium]|tara:strand:+ start:884 stop:1066 length:183 start_codon:yes stop_codon:yes gene_type:complete